MSRGLISFAHLRKILRSTFIEIRRRDNTMDHIALVKKVFKENFLRELTDEEASDIANKMISQSREAFSSIEGFTEEKFQQYISKNLVLLFSPSAVNAEIKKIIDTIGIEALENSPKYKRLSEMSNASCLALALKKVFNEEWMIKAQDYPDIILVKKNSRSFNNKHLDAVMLEIMEIPEHARASLGSDIELGIAELIKKKKFDKRYEGVPHLLVHLNIDQPGLNLKRVSELLNSFSGNPFHQIWTRANADPNSQIMDISLLTPEFHQTKIDFINDRDLYF